ncbi:MAG: ABC transporter substrate-binding protein [Alphaproteobacteria bacterium]|nr:ABC transporter substrate-binding protein [Alphaproteobacteria bacterium]
MLSKTISGLFALMVFISVQSSGAQTADPIRRIGFLSVYGESDPSSQSWHESFRRGLREKGWIPGKNITLVYRWIRSRRECQVSGRRACIPMLIDELIAQRVELIVVHGGHPARAIEKKAPNLPVVMAEASDAVGRGIVKSLAKPGGSITGLSSITPVLAAKRLEILKEIVPGLSRVGVIWTPNAPASTYAWKSIQDPARKLGLRLTSVELRRNSDIRKTLQDAVKEGVGAFIGTSGISSTFGVKRISRLVTATRLPAIFLDPASARHGVLSTYNRSNHDLYRRAANFVDKILKGAKPADMPVEQPTKFYLVINLKTAKALGITIPQSLLLRADEVIE